MKILQAASECYGLAKTGGLADMVSSLATALIENGSDTRICLPAYSGTIESLEQVTHVTTLNVFEHRLKVLSGNLPSHKAKILLLKCPELYERDGDPYRNGQGEEFADNGWRFGCFSKAIALLAQGGIGGWKPDLLHLHDWHTGLVPLFLREPFLHEPYIREQKPASKVLEQAAVKTVFTIHNFAFHGVFNRELFDRLGLPDASWSPAGIEFYDQFSFMKSALRYADAITAVSPRYAQEITTREYGSGLEGVVNDSEDRLTGIVNGIDEDEWNPNADRFIARRYDAKAVVPAKRANKKALQKSLGLPAMDIPLVTFIGRLAEQKGSDLILAARKQIAALRVQMVILGTGDKSQETDFRRWAETSPEQVAVINEVNEELAHQLTAAADLQLLPSRFEPCGLSQMYAQRYGTLPVARATGGLADTIVDATTANLSNGTATGFLFPDANVESLMNALTRGIRLLENVRAAGKVRRTAMKQDFSWKKSAQGYTEIYRELIGSHNSDSVVAADDRFLVQQDRRRAV